MKTWMWIVIAIAVIIIISIIGYYNSYSYKLRKAKKLFEEWAKSNDSKKLEDKINSLGFSINYTDTEFELRNKDGLGVMKLPKPNESNSETKRINNQAVKNKIKFITVKKTRIYQWFKQMQPMEPDQYLRKDTTVEGVTLSAPEPLAQVSSTGGVTYITYIEIAENQYIKAEDALAQMPSNPTS